MSQLIPIGNTETAFSAGLFTVLANSEKVLYIKGVAGKNAPAPSGVYFEIAHVTSGGDYTVMATVDASNINDKGRIPAGNWAARRLAVTAGTETAGMDVEG